MTIAGRMDHILPLSVSHNHLEVPYFSHEAYDNVSFWSYPERRSWDIRLLRDNIYGRRSPIQAAGFTQAWLFFGTLSEVTGLPVRGTNFIRGSGPDGRLLITTERLHFYLEMWKERAQRTSDKQRLFRLSKACLDFVLSYTTPRFLIPEHPEVAVSVEMLLVALGDTFKEIYGKDALKIPSSLAPDGVDSDIPPGSNQNVTKYLKSRMVSQGWCPHRLASFGDGIHSDTIYTLSLMGTRDLLSGHERCSEDACVGNHVDDTTYNETPRHERQDCECDFVGVDVQTAARVIEKGQIPIVTVYKGTDEGVRLEITPYEMGMAYIAISHVWSHGLGNPDENALRSCQLLELDRLLKQCLEEQNLEDTSIQTQPVYFWIDTLCLPLRPHHIRKAAIKQMRHCYQNATTVLVLDRHIRRCTAYTPSLTIEPLLQITISDWRYRVWTLQEAVFAQNLIFQFVDAMVHVNDLFSAHFHTGFTEEPSHVVMFILFSMAPIAGVGLGTTGKSLRDHRPSLTPVMWSLQGRAISKPEDEPLCAASLLRDDHVLDAILECPKEDRMKVFWRSQGRVPVWVPFIEGPKIQDKGYRWAPSSLRYKLQPNTLAPALSEDFGEIHPDGLGLMITRPGFLLLEREIRRELENVNVNAFRICDDLGSLYGILRSPDKSNPLFTNLGEDIAIIVSERTNAYDPQVLVISIISREWDLDESPSTIRGQVLCRGTIVPQHSLGQKIFGPDFIISCKAERVPANQRWLLE